MSRGPTRSATSTPRWQRDGSLVIDGVTFVPSPPGAGRFQSSSSRFCLVKRRDLVEDYLALIDDLRPKVIVELGVLEGGSTALLALAAEPEKLVAVEKAAARSSGLADLIAERRLEDRLHVHYGTDQADTECLTAIVDAALDGRAIDLVVDDASHAVEPTRASFNVLFPRIRPGGVFLLEDWSWAHVGFGSHRLDEVPLTAVLFELVMALPSTPGLISEIRITQGWAAVVRGDKQLDRATFDLSAAYSARGRDLVAPLADRAGH
ncbi:MAG TPA: class I SAM-dependent methyltransferase [Acidimicrobiales bacterium]|nr:class I SAM-dependent methyltransferase [Acidimicrobiales bacterium]